jgi:carbohydrate kinase (thermoresistant glucokinase family)
MIVVLMGVCGVGKTTVGRLLAERIGARFLEGDEFHPPANVEKMRAGTPLDDADREPWLRSLAAEMRRCAEAGRDVVLACSALKHAYRGILAGGRSDVSFIHLAGAPALIQARLDARQGHYMPPALLPSQLAALEPPGSDEPAITVDVSGTPEMIVAAILTALRGMPLSRSAGEGGER